MCKSIFDYFMRGLQQLSLIDSHLSFLCVGVCVRVFTHTYTYYHTFNCTPCVWSVSLCLTMAFPTVAPSPFLFILFCKSQITL